MALKEDIETVAKHGLGLLTEVGAHKPTLNTGPTKTLDDYARVKVGTTYETDRGDIMVYRWHEQHTYAYVHDLAQDLDQGFCAEARKLIEEYGIKPPDYVPPKPYFYCTHNPITDVSTINSSIPGITPLVMKGYWMCPPMYFSFCVYGGQVLLKQVFKADKLNPIFRYFYSPEQPVTCPKWRLIEGFEEQILADGLDQILRNEKARQFRHARLLQNVVTTTLPIDPDFVPIWVEDESIVNKETVKQYYKDLERINLSKEWNLGGKPSLLSQAIEEARNPTPTKHSYHKTPIIKGKAGEFSKIEEEFQEAKDALKQGNRLMVLIELSDLFGAVECYLEKHFPGVKVEDVLKQGKDTNEVFRKGGRVNRDPESDPGTR